MNIGVLVLAYLFFGVICFLASASERKFLLSFSFLTGLSILALHGIWIILRGIESKHLPLTNTYETLVFLSFLIIAIYFLTFRRYRMVIVGGFAGLIASVVLALTSLLSPEIEPLIPSLKSNWLLFHVTSVFIGYSSFALAAASAAVYLCSEIFQSFQRYRFCYGTGFYSSPRKQNLSRPEPVPEKTSETLEYLDWLTYRFIALGFPFLTLGISLGAVWANASWGRYWNWDAKETWAFITWLIYGICFHLRYDKKYHGWPMALVTLFGFAAVMFTYFGVNFWLSSLHAYG
ncbi:MAG: c-type cytochrome biogenesis protein CcsB [Candidatus Omnitrophica bacterium]|nr:c-type cytochrome biogenesis protein CcsB [Candidatus Omnitrophota bacterium]